MGKPPLFAFAPTSLVREIEKNAPDLEKIGIGDHLCPLDCDGVVLGCTHFVYLKEKIDQFYGAPCYDGNAGTAKRLRYILKRTKNGKNPSSFRGNIFFAGESALKNEMLFKRMFL
jgi:glutamate racemase